MASGCASNDTGIFTQGCKTDIEWFFCYRPDVLVEVTANSSQEIVAFIYHPAAKKYLFRLRNMPDIHTEKAQNPGGFFGDFFCKIIAFFHVLVDIWAGYLPLFLQYLFQA